MWLVRGTFWVWGGGVGLRAFFCGETSPPTPGFLWGDQSPHAPPKCAHLGAFHEVVRLGCVVFGLGGVGLRAFFVLSSTFLSSCPGRKNIHSPHPMG